MGLFQKAAMCLFPKETKCLPPSAEEDLSVETRDASPAHLLLKIESFSLLWKNGIKEYESREFEVGGHKWKLIIYPDGDEIGKKSEHISVYLSMLGTSSLPVNWEVNVHFNILLFNQMLDNYTCFRGKMRRFHAINTKWGFSKLISKKSFTDTSNGYLVGDNCVFGAEVFVINSQRVIERVAVRDVATPYKHNLVISELSKLAQKVIWKSEEFAAGDYKWKILLYPNGNRSGEGRYVSIYLECVDSASFAPHEKVLADICIRIRNKKHYKHHSFNFSHWFSSAATNWGYHDFIEIGKIRDPEKGFVVDNSCSLETEISIKAAVGHDAPM